MLLALLCRLRLRFSRLSIWVVAASYRSWNYAKSTVAILAQGTTSGPCDTAGLFCPSALRLASRLAQPPSGSTGFCRPPECRLAFAGPPSWMPRRRALSGLPSVDWLLQAPRVERRVDCLLRVPRGSTGFCRPLPSRAARRRLVARPRPTWLGRLVPAGLRS